MSKKNYLLFICVVSTIGGFLFGYDTAVISGTLTFVRNQFAMNSMLEGWFVGSALLGCVLGVSQAGILSDLFGRKKILILSSLFLAVSAIGCMVSGNLVMLIIYRLVGGLGVGIASMLSPLYISEISFPTVRGRMVTLYQFAITIGILCAYFINAGLLSISENCTFSGFWKWTVNDEIWRSMFGMEIIPAIIFLSLLFLVPESPRWLIAKEKDDIAEGILNRVMSKAEAESEMKDIQEVLAEEPGTWKEMFHPGIRMAMFIGISLAILSQLTGINAIIYYGPKIFEEAGFGVGGSLSGQVVIGVVNVLFTLIAIWKIDQIGRRVLLMVGCLGMMVSHIIIGLLFQTGNSNGIVLLIMTLCFIAFFAFSFGPVIWTLLSEIYPIKIRGRAMSVATLSLWIGTYIIGQMVPWMIENLTPQGTFWLFALMCTPAIFIVWKLVPETKQKSLEEIEHYWLTRGRRY